MGYELIILTNRYGKVVKIFSIPESQMNPESTEGWEATRKSLLDVGATASYYGLTIQRVKPEVCGLGIVASIIRELHEDRDD
jgi:hypothetical protein